MLSDQSTGQTTLLLTQLGSYCPRNGLMGHFQEEIITMRDRIISFATGLGLNTCAKAYVQKGISLPLYGGLGK